MASATKQKIAKGGVLLHMILGLEFSCIWEMIGIKGNSVRERIPDICDG